MSFAEFNSVNCSSQAMLKLLEKISDPATALYKTIIISGAIGSGRKTLAQYLQKVHVTLARYEIVDLAELAIVEDRKIYICQDADFVPQDNEIFMIQMPSLFERKEDLVALAEFYIQVHALMSGKSRILISDKAKEKILAYTWPGEFPELERVLEQAVKSCDKNIIEPEDLALDEINKDLHFSLGLKLENVERQYILQTLFFAQQNRTRAAEILGISIRTLRNKLNQYRQEGYL